MTYAVWNSCIAPLSLHPSARSAYSTRAVASVWWVFALVITSSYTANLATLLAKKSSDQVISNVQELADNQLDIDYGAKLKGSTYNFFEVRTSHNRPGSPQHNYCTVITYILFSGFRSSIRGETLMGSLGCVCPSVTDNFLRINWTDSLNFGTHKNFCDLNTNALGVFSIGVAIAQN